MGQKIDSEKNMLYGAPIDAEAESEVRLFLKSLKKKLYSKNQPLLAPKMPIFAI